MKMTTTLEAMTAAGLKPKCEECLYWHRWQSDASHSTHPPFGDCRRHAPTLAVEHKPRDGSVMMHAATKWPSTRGLGPACGDFAIKPAEPTQVAV